MIKFSQKKPQLIWALWMIGLGISLLLLYTSGYVRSLEHYAKAFLVPDLSFSWYPTFLIIYGIATLCELLGGKLFTPVVLFTGLALLPLGIYTTSTYNLGSSIDTTTVFIYMQLVHISEFLTGVFTLFKLLQKKTP